MPPRTANSPCSSAGSSRVNRRRPAAPPDPSGRCPVPASDRSTALSSAPGALTRGSSAAADATTTRAGAAGERVQRPGAGRRDADVRRHAAIRIDLVRRKRQDGRGPTRSDRPSSADRKNGRRRRPARGRRRRHHVQHHAVRRAVRPRRHVQRFRRASARTPPRAGAPSRCGRPPP